MRIGLFNSVIVSAIILAAGDQGANALNLQSLTMEEDLSKVPKSLSQSASELEAGGEVSTGADTEFLSGLKSMAK